MKYFIDTEFLEGSQKSFFDNTKPTIDLISIGIVCEDRRKYYAISKDFNLKEAWNRWEQRTREGDRNNIEPRKYWIRENILKPIMVELQVQYNKDAGLSLDGWKYKDFKFLINKYGKSNVQIAEEIKMFIALKDITGGFGTRVIMNNSDKEYKDRMNNLLMNNMEYIPEFYGYYSDYDWVVFCWLFGKMVDLPKWFPMYCKDLKQMLDEKALSYDRYSLQNLLYPTFTHDYYSFLDSKGDNYKISELKNHENYPKEINTHNALSDAQWNYKLYKFLQQL